MATKNDINTHARRLLGRAADRLEVDGWCQGSFSNEYGQVCAAGAIFASQDLLEEATHATARAFGLLTEYINGDVIETSVVDWNDHPDQTFDDVVAALREVAGAVLR